MIKKAAAMNLKLITCLGAMLLFASAGAGCQALQCWPCQHSGCAKKTLNEGSIVETQLDLSPANAFVSVHYAKLKPRRVVIVTPHNRTSLFPEQTRFAEAFAAALRRKGVVEAVIAAPTTCSINAIQSGRFDEEQLVQVAAQYNADAVLYCEVTDFCAYAPLSASVSLSLVDARESVVLLSTDGSWDLRSPDDAYQFRSLLIQSGDQAEVEMKFNSPSEFTTFIGLLTADFISRY